MGIVSASIHPLLSFGWNISPFTFKVIIDLYIISITILLMVLLIFQHKLKIFIFILKIIFKNYSDPID